MLDELKFAVRRAKANVPVAQIENKEALNMRRINIATHIKQGLEEVNKTFKRFPVSLILCIIFASVAIYRMEMPYERIKDVDEILNRIMAVVVLGVPFSLGVSLLVERFWGNCCNSLKLGVNIGKIVLLVLYYYFVMKDFDMVSVVRLVMLAFTMTLISLSALYMLNKENFEIYIIRIMTKVVTTTFFSLMLGLGVIFTLLTIETLLLENMSFKLYFYVWIIVGCIFAPVHFLRGFPNKHDDFELSGYSKVIKSRIFSLRN